ncbi:MAG: carbohydrate ABC transporter permease [Candidatus Caldatribacteriaceae bacterium]
MNQKYVYPYSFVIVGVILYLVFFIAPSVMGMYCSFTDWNRYSNKINFVGLKNYRTIFSAQSIYYRYLGNTLKFTFVSNLVKIIPALFLALLFTGNLKGEKIHRAILFFPATLSFIVIGLIFRSLLHPETDFLNQTFRTTGLEFLAQGWLIKPKWAWFSIYAVDAWRGLGYVMTIFIAGLQSIPKTYYEAASIDGAGFLHKLVFITLPMLKPAITVNLILASPTVCGYSTSFSS